MEPIRRSLPSEITRDGNTLRGFIPYNAPARIFERGKSFTEVIRPGAFARSIAAAGDIISTFNHDLNRLLGRTSSGTLSLTDGPDGLRYSVALPESAADVRELLARGDLKGSSFTAFPHQDGQTWKGDHRELTSLQLIEIGPVVAPAYPTSGAELRQLGEIPPPTDGRGRFFAALVELMRRS